MLNVTKYHRNSQNYELPELSQKQQAAVLLLASGKNQTQVAEELDIARETISKWKSSNPKFVAKLNEVRGEIIEKLNSRIQSTIEKALSSVESGVIMDPKIALEFLKLAKVFEKFSPAEPPEDSDPETVLNKMASDLATKEHAARSNALIAGRSFSDLPEIHALREEKKRELISEISDIEGESIS